ncbi:MAG TPA: retropepsin-like aspartic protease [Candidatus Bathyarchaeia archaeon]|nr:retropepsin-like aspartic protease [Candidatus Bathyarchaeia archaeon]
MFIRPRGVFVHALALAALFLAASPQQVSPLDEQMAKLYEQQRFLELRTLLASQTGNTPDLVYYRGMLANAFNRPAESIDLLSAFLQRVGDGLPETALRDILSVLDEDYTMLFQYGKAAEVREREMPIVRKTMSRTELEGYVSITALWRALASAPPQTVEIPGDTELALTERGEVTAAINGVEVPLLPDTGSELSMITRSDAERIGLEILDVDVAIGTATGKVVKAQACLVPELRLGPISVRNAVFLVVPEARLHFSELRLQLRGLIGFPILAGLAELTFTRRGKLVVSSPPHLEDPPNFFLGQTDPVLEAQYEGRRLLFFLDTGSFQTELFPSFFKAFAPEVLRFGIFRPATVEGVGGRATTPIYLMSGLSFRVAGEDVRFNKTIPVLPRTSGDPSERFDGTFGLDILDDLRELTVNYGAMRISLR